MKFKNIICSWVQMRSLIQTKYYSNPCRLFCSSANFNNLEVKQSQWKKKSKPIEEYFLNVKVQSILTKITGLDYDKIYRPIQHKLRAPKYIFATDEKLNELREDAKQRALKKLQIPPIMEERKPIEEELDYNPEIQGLQTSNVLFIDITQNVPERERFMTVREPDGTLRKANWDERRRLNEIYFPVPGRKYVIPAYFESPHLDNVLDEEEYIFVLDSACVQFDPDDPVYIKVIHTTYDHIASRKKFDVLRSTRHFGSMAFYFAWQQKVEGLLLDMIERELMSDAADLIDLYHILNDLPAIDKLSKTDVDIVSDFIAENTSPLKPQLENALQTYKDVHSKMQQEDTQESVSS